MSKATSESEHLKDMLVGNILAVSWPEVVQDGRALRARSALFHYVFRRQFLAISMDHDAGRGRRALRALWDFLFYASFGFVVTSSVSIAGVLLVFCYLIVPSVAAMLFAERIGAAAGDRLDDGDGRLGARRLPLGQARPAHRRDHRLHLRPGADPDGLFRPLILRSPGLRGAVRPRPARC